MFACDSKCMLTCAAGVHMESSARVAGKERGGWKGDEGEVV